MRNTYIYNIIYFDLLLLRSFLLLYSWLSWFFHFHESIKLSTTNNLKKKKKIPKIRYNSNELQELGIHISGERFGTDVNVCARVAYVGAENSRFDELYGVSWRAWSPIWYFIFFAMTRALWTEHKSFVCVCVCVCVCVRICMYMYVYG